MMVWLSPHDGECPVYLLNKYADKSFEGAILLLILMIVFGIGIGLVTALIIERKLLKNQENTAE